MKSDEFAQRVYQALRRRFKVRGHGSVREAERYMGVGKTYFADIWRGKGELNMRQLGAVLEFLEVEPESFFRHELRDSYSEAIAAFCAADMPQEVKSILLKPGEEP